MDVFLFILHHISENGFVPTTPHRHPLPGSGEPRFLSEAEVEAFGVSVRLFITHLSLEREIRTP